MKRASFVVLMWLLLVLRSNAFIYLSEPGYYELNGSTATMSVYRIDNDNPFTAPAYLSLWATKEPYYGGSISGFRIAQAYVGELAPYSTEFFVERSGGFRPPPNGKYYITLLVGRWDGSQILANDFLYMGTETFGPKEPIISSATFTNGFLGTPFKYQIRALNGPTGFGAADLPPGLTVSKSTGLISGTPTLAGGFVSTIWATNTGGAGFAELYINIYKKPPVIKSALSLTTMAGSPLIYQIVATQSPESFQADNLPAGLQFNDLTGTIYGTVESPGTHHVTIHAINSAGSDVKGLVLNVQGSAPIISNQPQSLVVFPGNSASFHVFSSGTPPLSYQWHFNGTNILDATSPDLLLGEASKINAGKYSVTVSNAWGKVTSSNATLIVSPFAKGGSTLAACRSIALEDLDLSDEDGFLLSFFSTYDGRKDVRPLYENLGTEYLRSKELRPRAGAPGIYEADFGSTDGNPQYLVYGQITISIPMNDLDRNGLADVLQPWSPASFTASTIFNLEYPYPDPLPLLTDFQREAGQSSGTLGHLSEDGSILQGSWSLAHASGWLTYLRTNGQSLATIRFLLTDPFGRLFSVQGSTPFTVNSVDQITLPSFTLTGTTNNHRKYSLSGNTVLKRSGNRYVGNFKFLDGLSDTRWSDYTDWVLEFEDLNDLDGNGIPDFSDKLPALPAFTRMPLAQTVVAGSNTTFTVLTTGASPQGYQWKFNGTPIPDAISPSLYLPLVTSENQGSYSVVVSNVAGMVESKPALLTVLCQYSLAASQSNFPSAGSEATLMITASPSCAWTLENTNSWIVLGPKSENETGFVRTFSVAPNTGLVARQGYVKLANRSVRIVQQGQVYFQFSALSYTIGEASPMATITIKRRGPLTGTQNVRFSTTDDSAVAGQDYFSTNGIALFTAGVATRTFSVPVVRDTIDETNKTLSLYLSEPTDGAFLGTSNVATLTIVDDDSGGALQFSVPTYTVGEASAFANMVITRSGGVASGVSVDLSVTDRTATQGLDCGNASTNLVFNANETSKTIRIPIFNDSVDETNETLLLQLGNPTGGASLGSVNSAILTITDDDVGGTIAFSAAKYQANETNLGALITLTRTGGKASGVTVDYFTAGGTALDRVDYTNVSGTLAFGSNELSKTFSVPLVNNELAGGSRTVLLGLTNAGGGATLGLQKTALLTILDDEVGFTFKTALQTNLESSGATILTVLRTGPLTATNAIRLNTTEGSALAGVDFAATNGLLVFRPGIASLNFNVPIVNDTLSEGNETFVARLEEPTGGALVGSQGEMTVLIVDNDAVSGTLVAPASSVPVLLSMTRLENGSLALRFSGTEGKPVQIEASYDLKNWELIGTVTDSGSSGSFVDADAAKASQRFYRLRVD